MRAAGLVIPLALTLAAATIPKSAPERVGLSPAGLKNIRQVVERHIAAGNTKGAVVAAARRGRQVHLEAYGSSDLQSKNRMSASSIFHIMSMTKPVTAVAVLMLIEAGKLRLEDPVSRYILEFANLTVAAPGPVSARRPITIQDLLTHTSGLVSGPVSFNEAARLAPFEIDEKLADVIPRFGKVPLEFQPGERWAYSPTAGFDTLLRIVEIVSGQSGDRFLRSRIFQPLGMKDTFFWTPHAGRLVPLYDRTPQGFARIENQYGIAPTAYLSGSGGLVSTAQDFLQFGQMLLNGGQANGARLLTSPSVDLMRSAFVKEFDSPLDDATGVTPGMAFGLGVQIVTDPAAAGYSVGAGSFGWDGSYGSIGTHFWVDPSNQMVGVVLLQVPSSRVFRDVEKTLADAIVE